MQRIRAVMVAGLGFLLLAVMFASPVAATTTDTASNLLDCPSASGVMSAAINLPVTNPSYALTVSYVQSPSGTFTFSVTTPTGGSAPTGVIEYCVFPTDLGGTPTGVIPSGTAANCPGSDCTTSVVEATHAWTAGTGNGYVSAIRSDGDPANIPYDGATTQVLTIVWDPATPPGFIIVLHINDATICGASAQTCFVIPNGSYQFPPPPPPPSVPEFPLGLALLFAAVVPALLLIKRRNLPLN